MRKQIIALALGIGLLLASCESQNAIPSSSPTVSVNSSIEPSPAPTESEERDLDDLAERLGYSFITKSESTGNQRIIGGVDITEGELFDAASDVCGGKTIMLTKLYDLDATYNPTGEKSLNISVEIDDADKFVSIAESLVRTMDLSDFDGMSIQPITGNRSCMISVIFDKNDMKYKSKCTDWTDEKLFEEAYYSSELFLLLSVEANYPIVSKGSMSLEAISSDIEKTIEEHSNGECKAYVTYTEDEFNITYTFRSLGMLAASLKEQGAGADDPAWVGQKDDLLSVYASIDTILQDAGYGDLTLIINVFYDDGQDGILLLIAYDGKIAFDVLAD